MAGEQDKVRGRVDIVFLLDVTYSMEPCIEALKQNIKMFIDSLTTKDGQNMSPVRDWRGKVVGYRDFKEDSEPYIDNPFVRDVGQLKGQLENLKTEGGGDEPESLLDALYKVGAMGQMEKGSQTEDPSKWRYSSAAARVVIVFTDASCHPTMVIPEAKGGTVKDVQTLLMNKRIILSLFAPKNDLYMELAELDKCEYEPLEDAAGNSLSIGDFTRDQAKFQATLKALAKSVSKSAETPAL